jgi:hypothetical protein
MPWRPSRGSPSRLPAHPRTSIPDFWEESLGKIPNENDADLHTSVAGPCFRVGPSKLGAPCIVLDVHRADYVANGTTYYSGQAVIYPRIVYQSLIAANQGTIRSRLFAAPKSSTRSPVPGPAIVYCDWLHRHQGNEQEGAQGVT